MLRLLKTRVPVLGAILWLSCAGGLFAAGPGGPDMFSRGASGFRGAAQRSLANGKPLFLYFYTDWCGYCRQFERELLSSAAVIKALGQFEVAAVNPESGDEEAALGDSYGIQSFPTLLVQTPGPQGPVALRRIIEEGGGARLMTPDEFVKALGLAAEAARSKPSR